MKLSIENAIKTLIKIVSLQNEEVNLPFQFDWKRIGSIIQTAREAYAYSLKEVSNQTGISASHIWHIEKGDKEGSAELMARLADALGFPFAFLLEMGLVITPAQFKERIPLQSIPSDLVGITTTLNTKHREQVADFIAGCAVVWAYLLRSSNPYLLVEFFDYPRGAHKIRFRRAITDLENYSAADRSFKLDFLSVKPLETLRSQNLIEWDLVEDYLSESRKKITTVPFPWTPVPRFPFEDVFANPRDPKIIVQDDRAKRTLNRVRKLLRD